MNSKLSGMMLLIYQIYLQNLIKLISSLQDNDINLIKAKSSISTFISKLNLLKWILGRHELCQFPSLSELHGKCRVKTDDLQVYCDHLNVLHEDMVERFKDLRWLKFQIV
jgi:hypothetical protein